jgi:hypothetical protein
MENMEEVFASLNVSKILIAIIKTVGEVKVPTDLFINAAMKDYELKVDYNSEDQTFSFSLKEKDEPANNDVISEDAE